MKTLSLSELIAALQNAQKEGIETVCVYQSSSDLIDALFEETGVKKADSLMVLQEMLYPPAWGLKLRQWVF